MPWFGSWYGPSGTGGGSVVFPPLSNVTTADLIRDRIIDVIESLTPDLLAGDKFRRYRNEGNGDFEAWATANPDGAWRRFQVRDVGRDQPPEVSNTDVEERLITFSIVVAYPQTSRAGRKNALDRDTAMSHDQHDIEHAIGLTGRGNFMPPDYPDASWRSGSTTRSVRQAVDFLEIEQTMAFYRQQF